MKSVQISHLVIRGLNKGLSTNYGIYCTFSLKMYPYIVHGSNKWYEKYLESIFRFPHLLIRGLDKGLSTN